jgi:hypothetical protein
MATSLVTPCHRLHVARQLHESLEEAQNTRYYIFTSKHVPLTRSAVPAANNTVKDAMIDVYRNMIQGKQATANDVSLAIRYVPWESNTLYTMYDDEADLSDDDFYVVVNATSYYHVFKCLDNNMESYSTTEPDFAHIVGSNTAVYQTADGYRWKYMYSVTNAKRLKFATATLFPLVANDDVVTSAVDGAIDVIKIEDGGLGYDNYVTGTFSADSIRVGGNTRVYEIVNTRSSSVNGFYTDCLLYLSGGTGAGQFKTVTDFWVNSTGKYIAVNSSFTNTPSTGTIYQIYPRIDIRGDGSQTINAVARALVNASNSNTIYRIEVLNRGAGYDYATANVLANNVVGVSKNAEVRVIQSPPKGHGFDAAKELRCNSVIFSVTFSNSESNTILTEGQFMQFGVLKDPLFANVRFDLVDKTGSFSTGERVVRISPKRTNREMRVTATSNVITCDNGDFTSQYAAGDFIYLVDLELANHQLGVVSSVTNATHLRLTTNGLFSCTTALAYDPVITADCYVSNVVDSNTVLMSNTSGDFGMDDRIIGVISGAHGTISAITRNGMAKGFDTFIQLYKYEGVMTSGTFEENEMVYQVDTSNSHAWLYATVNAGASLEFYTSNQTGSFIINDELNTIVGETSEAVAQLTSKYSPELVFGSGDVLFVENIEPVERTNAQQETVKIVFEF